MTPEVPLLQELSPPTFTFTAAYSVKVKDISAPIVGQEKDVFLDFQIQYIFLYVIKFCPTGVVNTDIMD